MVYTEGQGEYCYKEDKLSGRTCEDCTERNYRKRNYRKWRKQNSCYFLSNNKVLF